MCGISGIISEKQTVDSAVLNGMLEAVSHRGPDAKGTWMNNTRTVALGHCRLSVIDLSEAANQPLLYQDRFTVVHNGEIYNFEELRSRLLKEGFRFLTHSDTEIIAALYSKYGPECLSMLEGMFAFVIYDHQKETTFIARDRLGEKPLFFTILNGSFYFSSEIKSFAKAGIPLEARHDMLLYYLAMGFTRSASDPFATFYKNIFLLPPAHYIEIKAASSQPVFHRYWTLEQKEDPSITASDAASQLYSMLKESVEKRCRTDVPLGSSLSGGLDSSSILAFYARHHRPQTFSAVFPGFERSEGDEISRMNQHYQANAHEVNPTAEDLATELALFSFAHDEPVLSPSAFAQFKVYQLAAKSGVKVILDGQGADEILAGYTKYFKWYWQELLISRSPDFRREINLGKANNPSLNWGISNYIGAFDPEFTAKMLKRKVISGIRKTSYIHKEYIRHHLDPSLTEKPVVRKLSDILHFNTTKFGLQELLQYADRNSMIHGVEVRLPFLKHQLVEFLFTLPSNLLINNGFGKWILREAMQKDLPQEIVWRKEKVGFETPDSLWMNDARMTGLVKKAVKTLQEKNILNRGLTVTHRPAGPLAHTHDGRIYEKGLRVI
jgi:asparagine synthase (glutamine-hydrolysing)